MKAVLFASALFGSVLAQELGTLPSCATTCLTKFTTGAQIGDCASLDAACICADSHFLSGIACCLQGSCNQSDQLSATNYAIQFCGAQGVQVPHSVDSLCPSGAASAGTASSTQPPSTAGTPAASGSGTGAVATPTRPASGTLSTGASTAAPTAATTSTPPSAGNNLVSPVLELLGGLVAVAFFLY